MKNWQRIFKWRKECKLKRVLFFKNLNIQVSKHRLWIFKVIKTLTKSFLGADRTSLLLLIINSLLPILSDSSTRASKYKSSTFYFSGHSLISCPQSILFQTLSTTLKPWISHFILLTLNRWPCTIIHRENRKKPLKYANSTLISLPCIYKLPYYHLHLSSPPFFQFQKAFLLPKADHSNHKQDTCPFYLLRHLTHVLLLAE